MLLAMVIDDSVINWILGTAAVVLPTVGTTIVLLWRKLIAFISPKVTKVFDSHTELVEQMKANVPVVAKTMSAMSETMEKLGETQDKQCERLEQHSRALETILSEVKKSNPSQGIVK